MSAGFHAAMRIGRLGEVVGAVDHRGHAAGLEQGPDVVVQGIGDPGLGEVRTREAGFEYRVSKT